MIRIIIILKIPFFVSLEFYIIFKSTPSHGLLAAVYKLYIIFSTDMNSFIPEEDKPAFEKFLFDHNIHSKSPMGNIPSPPPPPTGSHHQGQNSELENFLLELDQEMNSILTTNF